MGDGDGVVLGGRDATDGVFEGEEEAGCVWCVWYGGDGDGNGGCVVV